MKIGVIVASSLVEKNELLYQTVRQNCINDEVVNFGCFKNEEYSYIEVSILIGLLINSGATNFIVTGCSSGQGMMLACNNIPNVLCGYAPSGKDAYLFAQINNGNVISLPLGQDYTYLGEDNLKDTIKQLFKEPFGLGYPRKDAERKLADTKLLKKVRSKSQVGIIDLLNNLDIDLIHKVLRKENVINYILTNGTNKEVINWIMEKKDEKELKDIELEKVSGGDDAQDIIAKGSSNDETQPVREFEK